MEEGNFPKIWEYETPEKEKEAEKDLPASLREGINYFLAKSVRSIEAYEEQYGFDEETKRQVTEIKNLDRESLFEKLKGKLYRQQPLETVALFDLVSGFIEEELEAVRNSKKVDGSFGNDPQAYEGKIRNSLDKYTYQRDRLIDEVPELGKTYSKQDFEKWLAARLKIQEDTLKDIERKKETQIFYDNTLLVYKIFDHALSGRVLAGEEIKILLNLLDDDIRAYREAARDFILEYFLGQPYDGQELENLEKYILRYRQFKVGIESGEWVKVHSAG